MANKSLRAAQRALRLSKRKADPSHIFSQPAVAKALGTDSEGTALVDDLIGADLRLEDALALLKAAAILRPDDNVIMALSVVASNKIRVAKRHYEHLGTALASRSA